LVNGVEQHFPDAFDYIYYQEQSGKRIWKKISQDPQEAVSAADYQQSYMRAVHAGVPVKTDDIPIMVSHTLEPYLEQYKLSHRVESYNLMKQTLYEFYGLCRKNIVNRITRIDLLQYRAWLINKKRCERTASNKMLRVNQYIRHVLKQRPGEGLVTVKDARYVETEPEVYDDDELAAFFNSCGPFHLAVFKTLLMSGLRKAELESLTWEDVDFKAGALKVRAKRGFRPKTWKERTIEVPNELLEMLKTLPRNSQWVFANGNGNRYTHVWDDCRKIAKAAKVTDFHPHKFRATFATCLLQGGMDLKTVQKLLGHRALESTMRYLAKAQSKKVREKVNAIWA
jgi:integrase